MKIDTTEYEAAHGHKPRGTRYFTFSLYAEHVTLTQSYAGRWVEAKAQAIARDQALGATQITLHE